MTDTRKSPAHKGQAETMASTFVMELVETLLAGEHEEISIHAESQNFQYDSETGIETNEFLITTVTYENIVETDEKFEVTLSGTVENELGHTTTCGLYFFMWWDRTAISFRKNNPNCPEILSKKSLLINSDRNPERLSDSVFELDLYGKSISGQQQFLGQGRGYLVFGREG